MKVHDPNLAGPAGAGAARTRDLVRIGPSGGTDGTKRSADAQLVDDIHLSELVRSLRSLAADSPERQARIEQLARDYANGSYTVDAQSTAANIIDDTFSK